MAGLPADLQHPGLVLVEGATDEYLLRAWLRKENLSGVHVWRYDGKTNLSQTLKLLTKHPGFSRLRRILIVRDINGDADAAWQSVCGGLAGTVPPMPVPQNRDAWSDPAQVAAPGAAPPSPLRTAAVLLGNDAETGELEDWLLERATPVLLGECSELAVACAEEKSGQRLAKRGKALLHAALAVSGVPGMDLGQAYDAGMFAFRPADALPRLIEEAIEAV